MNCTICTINGKLCDTCRAEAAAIAARVFMDVNPDDGACDCATCTKRRKVAVKEFRKGGTLPPLPQLP